MNTISPFAPATETAPLPVNGVSFASCHCGLKESGSEDLLLVSLAPETTVAGVFTRSTTAAAPVDICRAHLRFGEARALIVHSGNANAFTGRSGELIVLESTKAISKIFNCPESSVFSAATGVIGQSFPSSLILSRLEELADKLDPDAGAQATRTIMTTDTFPKSISRCIETSQGPVVLTGMAKGAGMIAPDMATLLSFVFTDAKIDNSTLQQCLAVSNQASFSKISVDGDTSTNDTLLLFATGQATPTPISSADVELFQNALTDVLKELALLIVKDGEGISKFITVEITGARTDGEALSAAHSIAASPLVKTAMAGGHPNWGRVVMAVGKSGATVNKYRMSVWLGHILVAEGGDPVDHGQTTELTDYMSGDTIRIAVDLGSGSASETVYTCDLTHGYVDINAYYTT